MKFTKAHFRGISTATMNEKTQSVHRPVRKLPNQAGRQNGFTFLRDFYPTATVMVLVLVILLLPVTAAAAPKEITVMLPGDVPMVLVLVPKGSFQMGSPEDERGDVFENETLHEVTLSQSYYLGKTEVTQRQWEAVMGTPMRSECGDIAIGDDYPVYCVTWDRIQGPGGFMEKLNDYLGTTGFRLPTEAEWERGARAGTSTRFAHGDVLQCGDDCESCAEHDTYMWFCGNDTPAGPKLVGTKMANQFGLHDMHGNLYEIILDRYADDYGSTPGQAVVDPLGPGGNSGDIVIKGGDAQSEAKFARSAVRVASSPDDLAQNNQVGFRVATASLDGLPFQITAGLNDSWKSDDAAYQGFFFTVFENLGKIFIAWFTYDTEQPDEGISAVVGAAGQRWLTGLGTYVGDTATVSLELTYGGAFNTSIPLAVQEYEYGTVTIVFISCNEAVLTYDIPSAGLSGQITLHRIVPSNIALCEALSEL